MKVPAADNMAEDPDSGSDTDSAVGRGSDIDTAEAWATVLPAVPGSAAVPVLAVPQAALVSLSVLMTAPALTPLSVPLSLV